MTSEAHPTLSEALVRLWDKLPSLLKTLIPAVGALSIVLAPATLLISSRFYAFTDSNLRADHERVLGQIGSAFDELFSSSTVYLADLANNDVIKTCAATGCIDDASGAITLFKSELNAKSRSANYIEMGFLDLTGHETSRALVGNGGVVDAPGDGALFSTDPAPLLNADIGQPYIFPMTRDTRLAPSEAYQQPVLRIMMPVFVSGQRQGYITAVILIDNFLSQNFASNQQQEIFLLDTQKCLLASSDTTRRADLYKTWNGDADKTCYTDLDLQDWDVTLQTYGSTTLSTRVLHGPLSDSGQTWTIIVQQPTVVAYAQANALRALLIAAYTITILVVGILVAGADRAMKRLEHVEGNRKIAHARDIRFNPYIVGSPIEERSRFFGRTATLAQVFGIGVMGSDNVLIEGDRRIGKTSLLKQIMRRLQERRISDPHYWYCPVFLSLQGIPADQLYSTLIEHILHDTETDLHFDQNPSAYGVREFQDDISAVLKIPRGEGRQTRIVLLLDNMDLWFNGTPGYDTAFIKAFQELLVRVGNQLKVIAAGTHLPVNSFDRSFAVIRLGPLESAEAERLLREPVAEYYRFSDEAEAIILANSDLLPLEIQRLARHAVQVMLETDAPSITQAHAEQALKRALSDWEPTFRLLWNGGINKEGQTLERLSDEQRSLLLDCSVRDLPLAQTSTIPTDDIAYSDAQGNLRLTSIFRTWLARTAKN